MIFDLPLRKMIRIVGEDGAERFQYHPPWAAGPLLPGQTEPAFVLLTSRSAAMLILGEEGSTRAD